MTSEGLAQAQVNGQEESLWRAAHALAEHADLRRRMASRGRKSALNALADAWEMDAEESERRSDELKRLLEDRLRRGAVPGPRAFRPVRRGTQRG